MTDTEATQLLFQDDEFQTALMMSDVLMILITLQTLRYVPMVKMIVMTVIMMMRNHVKWGQHVNPYNLNFNRSKGKGQNTTIVTPKFESLTKNL